VAEQAVVCVSCGCPPLTGRSYCQSCGADTNPEAQVCIKCGMALASRAKKTGQSRQSSSGFPFWVAEPSGEVGSRNKVVAGVLAILLGVLGIHRFYLGYTKVAVWWLVVAIAGFILLGLPTVLLGILALIEGIMILTGSFDTDADGNSLVG